jgi:hypothetical protein
MANASVEKLKTLGILHGEKFVVGITATVFVVLVFLAITNPVLEMKPEELKSAATSASANLQAKQTESDILAKLERDQIIEPHFQKTIEGQIANALKPDGYRARLEWVTPEPGAGLIRDQPELIAPVELTAFPGRGGILIYAMNENGERKIDPGDPKKKGGPGGRGGTSGMSLGAGPGGGGGPSKKPTPEELRKAEIEKKKKEAIIAGAAPAEKKEEGAEEIPQGPYLEETKGKRWVVITATLDNAKLKKNYLMALKNEAIAFPNFKRVEAERQILQTDGSWGEWTAVEQEKNWEVLDNLPEVDVEFVPASQRPPELVDSLPFLKAGYWTGVHVAKLVPPEILKKNMETPPKGAGGGLDMQPGGGSSRQGPVNAGGGPGAGMQPGAAGTSRQGPGMGGAGGAPGGGEEMNFARYEDGTLMIRSIDFTVDEDQTYRFRLRIVVRNPNRDRTDVNPGVDVESKLLFGPWSEPSPSVTVPADVVAYAQAPDDVERRDDLVTFQVVRWDPLSGHTVIKTDSRGPGQIIGEYGSVPMPDSEGKGSKSERIDFNSRSLVLDTFGGRQKLPDIGVPRNQFDVPAMALIVQHDGNVVIRSQALDFTDEVREDMEANYKQAILDSNEARKKGSGSRIGGMGQGGKKKKKGRR